MTDISNGDMRWLERAFRVAEACREDDGVYRLAAVTVRGGSLLSVGVNKHRNNPLWLPELRREDWSTHAEDSALRQLVKPANCTLYVARATPGGRHALARPCVKCQMLAVEYGISKIIYTTDTGAEIMRVRDLEAAFTAA